MGQHGRVTSRITGFLQQALGPLPVRALAAMASSSVVETGPSESLLRAGDRWTSLFWVEHGALRLYYLDRQGRSANKNFYLDGALIWPLTPALADQPVNFWVEAVTPTRVWALPWTAWQSACADWPDWAALEHRTLARLLDDKMQREQSFLQRTATERYLDLCTQHPDWLSAIPLRHLASYLGVTDVALSRIRRRLNPG